MDCIHEWDYWFGWVIQRHPKGWYAYPNIESNVRPEGTWFGSLLEARDFITRAVEGGLA